MNPYKVPFSMLNFPLMQNFALGSMRVHWPIYKGQWPKMQKLTYWKPAFSIRKQNSSHLQDFCNAFSTKDSVKQLNQSQLVRAQCIFLLATLIPAHLFATRGRQKKFFNFSGNKVESQGVFVTKNITISPFPLSFPQLKTMHIPNRKNS